MDKIRLLRVLVWSFGGINLLLLGVIFFTQFNKPGRHGGPRNQIIKMLHLNDKQVTSYDSAILVHRQQTNEVNNQINILKKQLYASTALPLTDTVRDNRLIDSILLWQRKKERVNLSHFKAIKSICSPQQLEAYIKLSADLNTMFSPGDKRNGKDRQKPEHD